MNRRHLLTGSAAALGLSIAGCTGREDADDDETENGENGTGDDGAGGESDPDAESPDHARSGEDVPGRIDPLGHTLVEDPPFYSFGDLSPDGEWGVMGSFPTEQSAVASTLVDLEDVEAPNVVHEVDTSDPGAHTNDVKFDALRDGLYYRSQEGSLEGIEVVDFGYESGSPAEPEIVASLEAPNIGVHKLTTHPDEPVLYLVDLDEQTDVGVITVDVSSPDSPEIVHEIGPTGGCHDVEYDPVREVLHAAYIVGEAEGYVIYDAADPYELRELGHFEYDGEPNYTELGDPGFQMAHQADYDPDRDLGVVGDEVATGVPGGKHVFDLGWDEGSLEDPQPIGFTHSPDAREMTQTEGFWWTTHFHDVVRDGDETLLVDGGYRQGAWVCNISDPREPTPTERYATITGADQVADQSAETPGPASPPFAWAAVYHDGRDVVFVTDSLTGAYTFDVSAAEARGTDGRGPDDHYDAASLLEDDADAVADEDHDH